MFLTAHHFSHAHFFGTVKWTCGWQVHEVDAGYQQYEDGYTGEEVDVCFSAVGFHLELQVCDLGWMSVSACSFRCTSSLMKAGRCFVRIPELSFEVWRLNAFIEHEVRPARIPIPTIQESWPPKGPQGWEWREEIGLNVRVNTRIVHYTRYQQVGLAPGSAACLTHGFGIAKVFLCHAFADDYGVGVVECGEYVAFASGRLNTLW